MRLSYDDGGTVTGRWEFIGGGVDAVGVLADGGRVHTDVTSGVPREVIQRAERPKLALLSRDEALVVARLLEDMRVNSWVCSPGSWRTGSVTGSTGRRRKRDPK